MTTVPPDLSTESPPRPSQRLTVREVAGWVAGIGFTVAFAALFGLAGLSLGVFGLSGVVLVLVAVLLVLAVWPWRRAALPLSVVGLALAAGGVVSTMNESRIARTGGLLLEQPTVADEVQGADLRRGLGSVVVDLRHSRFRPGQHLAFSARSDAGRVVVVLPMDRCVDVRLHATPLDADAGLGGALVMSAASSLNLAVADERWTYYDYPDVDPFRADMVETPAYLQELSPVGTSGVGLFGRDLVRRWSGTSNFETVTASRVTGRRDAVKLDLRLASAGAITVTALPDSVGPLATNASRYDQVSDASWPRTVQLPPSPEEVGWAGRWRQDWSRSRDQLGRWRGWERRVVVAARDKAKLLAGPCASAAQLRNQWVAARYGLRPGNGDGHRRVLAVNGLGEVVASGERGARLASRSPDDLVRGTDLRLLDAAQARLRRESFLISLLETS